MVGDCGTLLPAQEEHQERERCGRAKNELAEVSQGVVLDLALRG